MTTVRFQAPMGQWFASGWRAISYNEFSYVGVPLVLPPGQYRWAHLPVWSEVGSCTLFSPDDPSVPELLLVRGMTVPLQGQTSYQVRGAYASFGILTLYLSDDPTASPGQLFPSFGPVQPIRRRVTMVTEPVILPTTDWQMIIDARDLVGTYQVVASMTDDAIIGYAQRVALLYPPVGEGSEPSGQTGVSDSAFSGGNPVRTTWPSDNIAFGALGITITASGPPSPGQPINATLTVLDLWAPFIF